MDVDDEVPTVGAKPLRRFWRTAFGFWSGRGAWIPWALIGLLIVCVVLQLLVQYRLNLWNRDFFNALERRDSKDILQQAYLLPALVASSVVLAATAVWGRMSFQWRWREWLTASLLDLWLSNDNFRRLDAGPGEPQFAEYRIAEDARVATDAPIDLLVGLLASILTAATFVAVLWTIGGSLAFNAFGVKVELPGYLVFASIGYAAITTSAMMVVGRKMAHVIERRNQAESELKFAVARLRSSPRPQTAGTTQSAPIGFAVSEVMRHWRRLRDQLVRTTLVSHANTLLAPLVGLILCVPQYIHHTMSLGEVTQAAAAFAAVQGAFNWLVDNYPRLAEWASSASRVGVLLFGLDVLPPIAPRANVSCEALKKRWPA
ncbi:MAG: ABC transporter [Reyranella sp.]|nr:ABC transporter [Reyranella sp.]MBL6651427.1 ABC transporter [Reyranella sp.]